LLDLFDAALHTTASGELADVRLSLGVGAASLQQSLLMEEQKTSGYSFVLPLQAGAVLARAEERTAARLGEAGRRLGIGFQLLDDLIGVFGDPARTGKSSTSDLRTRKQTPLLAHASTTGEWEAIRAHLGRELTDDELAEVRQLLTASGSRQFVEDLAEEHLSSARRALEELGLSSDLLASVTTGAASFAEGEEAAA